MFLISNVLYQNRIAIAKEIITCAVAFFLKNSGKTNFTACEDFSSEMNQVILVSLLAF